MNTHSDEAAWALSEFGGAQLGNTLRTARLVAVAQRAAQAPDGPVTSVFPKSAARQGAFRLLENPLVSPEALMAQAHRAGARRCAGQPYAYVPVDQTSLNLQDGTGRKGFGAVGRGRDRARGLQVMTALTVSPDGTPQGLAGQALWARPRGKKKRPQDRDKQLAKDKETQRWLDVMAQTRAAFAQQAPETRPWFQMDRGADAWPILMQGQDPEQWLTVRAASDRRLWTEPNQPKEYLWATMEQQEPLGGFVLHVPARKGRAERQAWMQLRACQLTLDIRDKRTKRHQPLRVWVVYALEVGTAPTPQSAVEWMLLTNYPADSIQAAQQVVFGYAQRWRIEDFHKTWKTGACRVESTQLRAVDHVIRWAVILASVAMRIQRLIHLSRAQPEQPATVEFSQAEIDATIRVRKPKGYRPGDVPPIVDMVRWIADQGGYTGKSSGGPPGAKVLGRGLERFDVLYRFCAENAATTEDKT